MIIDSKAPTRIDLAGGTIDIWPIYLLNSQLNAPALTINLGINLYAQAQLEITDTPAGQKPSITLQSHDQHAETRLTWDELEKRVDSLPPSLILSGKLISYFTRKTEPAHAADLRLKTSAQSPAGAGLGGSSTLAIAMLGALSSWAESKTVNPLTDGENLIEIARDIETTLIRVPAGLQDYYGAMYGGLQKLAWGVAKHTRKYLPQTLIPELEKRILLFYSGQSRNSGINNWALYKSFIDGDPSVRAMFRSISQATQELESAFENLTAASSSNWSAVNDAIAAEWAARKGLAAGISTPEMDQAFKIAEQEGRCAGKICGAGGGGCFFVFEPTGDQKKADFLRGKIAAIPGIRPLPFQGVSGGLQIQVSA